MPLTHLKVASLLIVILGIYSVKTFAGEYSQLPGVMHIHSTFSSGLYSIEELVAEAQKNDIEVLVVTDHDRVVMEYGLFPLRSLIKKKEERKSVLQIGAERYLTEIKKMNQRQRKVLVIAGVQSSPFYYWSGSPLNETLTAHDYRKELLLVGMDLAQDYLGIPVLHNGLSTRYIKDLLPRWLVIFSAFLLSIYLFFQKGTIRVFGLLIGGFCILLLINHHPFKSSRFDPFHGDQGIEPFQEEIDYVRQKGGLVFWAHPESNYSKHGVRMGPIKLVTQPYPHALIQSKNYTGFSAVYADTHTATEPGRHWDQILNAYCDGRRSNPIWGIAEADYHGSEKDVRLDSFQTIFLVKDKTVADVLDSLSKGRFYAVSKTARARLSLDLFQVKDETTGNSGLMGEALILKGVPTVKGRLTASDGSRQRVKVTIIRGGMSRWSFEGETPVDFDFADQDHWKGKTFYRLNVHASTSDTLLSNPIFVLKP